ncbi:maltose ABC transporter permease MalF [Roseateles chitosanitabidus]|uniref:maltose ABC transporter permease MalF n=1 Tax=Roseateles chitosanitabidus TaxID=65048 RepID=UPI000A01875A|nr:maltose ABC transporter permease MalF [Roseateles chitosanitabidus]MBO9686401.1 maltose ABC transporter permease MalF [Roseateles chitosanitabidus]
MNATTASTSALAASLPGSPLAEAYSQQAPGALERLARWLYWPVVALIAVAALYLVFTLYVAGQTWWAVGALALFGSGFAIYLSKAGFAYRYLFPGVAGMLLFIAFPLAYTTQIGFTNYSSAHLLSQERVREFLLEQHDAVLDEVREFSVHADGREFRLALRDPATGALQFVSPALGLRDARAPLNVTMQTPADARIAPTAAASSSATPAATDTPWGPALSLRELIAHRGALAQLRLHLPASAATSASTSPPADASTGTAGHLAGTGSTDTSLHYLGLREFGPIRPHYEEQPDGAMKRLKDGALFKPDEATGYYEGQGAAAGTHLAPGYKVMVGGHNYARMILDPEFRGPFLSIFGWTVMFSLLTVLCATAIGMTLAVLLNWEDLRFRTTYRTLLFLPYAVPGFISILVFKGLFNQNFGEINAILDALFGVRPAWFADPALARTMLLIVNVWLGYPYIMILCTGLLKAIPSDLYEASAIVGAGPLTNFFKITVPLIIKPLSPLLVSAFAFNFNNFVLIALLTDGRPDYLSTKIPAGQTDILVSYTYRIAFRDSGTDFGLAAAISTLIFVLVAAMSLLNLRLMRKANQ